MSHWSTARISSLQQPLCMTNQVHSVLAESFIISARTSLRFCSARSLDRGCLPPMPSARLFLAMHTLNPNITAHRTTTRTTFASGFFFLPTLEGALPLSSDSSHTRRNRFQDQRHILERSTIGVAAAATVRELLVIVVLGGSASILLLASKETHEVVWRSNSATSSLTT